LAVDPNVRFKSLYALLLPRDIFISAGVGQEGNGTYYMFSDGAYNTFNAESAISYKKLHWLRSLGSTESRILSLSQIVHDHHIQKIDFLNIDVEGNDLEVVQSYDWSVRPGVIAIESSNFNPDMPQENKMYQFLRSKKYRLAGFAGVSLVWVDGTI
jgi:hypothetical protein